MRKLKIFTAYDGISCIQEALHRAGITNYIIHASEIDPWGIKITQAHYPKTVQVGNIVNINPYDYKDFDLIVGGSPCQSMSRMGKNQGITTKSGIIISTLRQYIQLKAEWKKSKKPYEEFFNTSALYWEFVRILRGVQKYNPNVLFLLENVVNKMWESIITLSLGEEPKNINSNLVSAQNRDRNYWTNLPLSVISDKCITLNNIIHGAINGVGIRGRKDKGEKSYTKYRTVREDCKSNCIVTSPYMTGLYVSRDGKDRMFTPEQMEVLQTLPIGYTDVPGITKTKRHELIGNAWTVDVLVYFLENLPKALKSSRKGKKSFVKA
jgi:site-specific DNA-cytosine methylase